MITSKNGASMHDTRSHTFYVNLNVTSQNTASMHEIRSHTT